MRIRTLLTASIALAASLFGSVFATPAAAQMQRFGPTFTINRLSNGNLTNVRYTDVAWDSTNRVYLVVWGGFGEILGRFVAADGTPLGTDPFLISGPLTPQDYRDAPRVEFSTAANAFMIIWRDNRTDEHRPQVWGRSVAYNPATGSANFITADFMVTGAFVHAADTPSLAYSSGSNEFLILYNTDYDAKGRRFNINGTALGTEIQVAVSADPNELAWQASLTYNPTSNEYFIVYRFFSDTTMAGSIRGRRIQAGTDNLIGGTFDVDPPTAYDLAIPAVAFNPTNNRMLVVWYRSIGSTFTFAGRMMNADGTAAGSRFTLAPTASYVELDVNYSTRLGFFYTAFTHHDIFDLFGTRVTGAGAADAMNQVTVTASVTGTDYARLASATDRDEFLVTGNVWWNKAIGQRMTYNTSGISFAKNAPADGTSGLTSPVTLSWGAVAGASYQVCVDTVANSTCDTSWQNAAGTSIATNVGNGTYYWQVRATTGAGTAEANAGTWFTFNVGVIPNWFGKLTPWNGSTVGTSVTLSWGPLAGATFQVCVDTINDNSCNTSWQDAGGTTLVTPLAVGTYYWHVRAFLAGGGAVLADNGVSWSFSVSTTPPIPRPRLAYMNADNNGDAFVYNPSTGHWWRQVSLPGGGFQSTSGGWAPGWSTQRADFNSDGLTDLFVFSTTTGSWFKMLNDGGTGFTTQAAGGWWPGWERTVMDLDGDGISDVFLYDPVSGQWYKCISTPTGFTYFGGAWGPGWETYPMNFNGDALEDLFLFSRTTGAWYWALGAAGGGFTYPQNFGWSPDWKLYPADFNGDGLTDLLLHRPSTGEYYIATTTGAGFTYSSGIWQAGRTPWVSDLDADTKADVLLYSKTTGLWTEMRGNGAGAFTNVGSGAWSPGWDLYATDFNGDGRTDWLLYNPTNGQYWQAWNLTLGAFGYFGGSWLSGLAIVAGPPIR